MKNSAYESNYKTLSAAYAAAVKGELSFEKYAELYTENATGANKYSSLRGLDKLENVEPMYTFGRKTVANEIDPEQTTYKYTRAKNARALGEEDFPTQEAWANHVTACNRVFLALAEWHAALKADANPSAKLFRAVKQEAEKAAVNLRDSMGANCFVRVNSAVANAFIALCTKQKKAVGVVKTAALRSKNEVRAAVEDLVRAAINGVELSMIAAVNEQELSEYKKTVAAEEKAAKEAAKQAEKPAA